MNAQNKRDRLISAAATLFHRKGVVATSLADIAKDADIPIGNVYYYFKTKEELALAAILRHREQYVALFTTLNETQDDPRVRLKKSLEYYGQVSDEFTHYGCPIGKIVMDAGVDGSAITQACLEQARKHANLPMPGYTHLQRAVPSSIGLWLGSFAEAFCDDVAA